jgi:hypothetical protein
MDNRKEEFNYKSFETDALLKLKQGFSLEGENGVLASLLKRSLSVVFFVFQHLFQTVILFLKGTRPNFAIC